MGVQRDGCFVVHATRDAALHYLGTFDTARAASHAIVTNAREYGVEPKAQMTAEEAVRQAEEAVRQAAAEGLELVRSATSNSGYRGVHAQGSRFQANVSRGGTAVHLGFFDTAEAAALAVARDVREHSVQTRDVIALRAAGYTAAR